MSCLITVLPFHKSHLFPIAAGLRSVRCLSACLLLGALLTAPAPARATEPLARATTTAQGSSSRKALIQVRTSPGVYLPGPAIAVHVTSLKPVTPRVPELIELIIQQGLGEKYQELGLATRAPDTLIVCSITDFGLATGAEARTRSEYQKTGTTTVMDAEGNSHTEDQYGYVDVPYRALVFDARMSVKCEVKDVATGVLLYSDKFDAAYTDARDAAGGSSSDNLNVIYLKLAENAAGLILAQLRPQMYSELVELPSGKLKEASKLLEAGHWTRALDLLATVPQFKNPQDDAYRLYSIGVAHEALAYESLDPAETKRQLEQAAENYRRATELKPREDVFWAPKNRADLLLWQASALVAQVEAFKELRKTGSSSSASTPDQAAPAKMDLYRQVISKTQPAPSVITNQTVIQWAKSGLATDYITSSIKHAPATRFDLSPAEVLKLRREGVNDRVLKAMSESQHGRRYGFGRRGAIIVALSLLWWVPFALVR